MGAVVSESSLNLAQGLKHGSSSSQQPHFLHLLKSCSSSSMLHFLIQNPQVHQTSGYIILALVNRKESVHFLELYEANKL